MAAKCGIRAAAPGAEFAAPSFRARREKITLRWFHRVNSHKQVYSAMSTEKFDNTAGQFVY
jgi:hypothetical protein